MAKETLADVIDWVGLHAPPAIRTELIAALNAAIPETGTQPTMADYWRTLAETLVAKGHLDIAREAIRRWQMLAPADHPIHAVMGGPPPEQPKPERPPLPITKREEPTSRLVRIIDTHYTFKRIAPQMELVQGKKVVWGWETFLDEKDDSSRAVVNAFDDGTYGPWAVTGVSSDFAGAAAVEVVVRTMQRHFFYTVKKSDRLRNILVGIALPATAIVGVLAGWVLAALH